MGIASWLLSQERRFPLAGWQIAPNEEMSDFLEIMMTKQII